MNKTIVAWLWNNPRRRKWLWRSGAAVLLYSLVGFFLIPALIKWQLRKQLPLATHRTATVRQVKFNPYALSLTVRGLALTETNGVAFASFEELYVNFQLSSLFRLAWTFDEIRLQEPRAEIVLGKNGQFNFANLGSSTNAPPPAKRSGTSSIPRVLVFNLSITNGHMAFADLSRKTPFRSSYEPINLHLTSFTTKRDRNSPYSFEASSDTGRGISWAGTITAQPPASNGRLRVEGIQLPKHSPYIEDFTRAQLTDGTLDVEGNYRFEAGTNGVDLAVSNLAVTVSNLTLKDPDTGETVLGVAAYELRQGAFDLRSRQARIGSLVVREPSALVRRRADGTVNLPSLVLQRITPAGALTNAPAPAPSSEAPWVFTLDDYRLERGTVEFEDATVPGPFRTTLKPITMRIEHFTTAPNSDAAFQAELTTEAAEIVSLAANYSIDPVRATGNLKLTGFELKKYQPYLAPFFRGILAAGKSEVALEFSHRRGTNADVVTVSNALVRVSDLQVKSPDGSETVVQVPSFAVENISASLADKAVRVGAIKTSGAEIVARREADGAINLLRLLATNAPAPSTTGSKKTGPPPTSSEAGWRVVLDELEVRDYAVHLEDRQLPKPGKLEVDQLALTVRGAQFPSNTPVQTALSARINSSGTIATSGSVWPYSPASDTEVEVSGLALRSFQPWLEPLLKLDINSGALNVKGRVKFASADGTGPKLHFGGDLGVTNLVTTDQVLFKEFVRWDELAVKGVDFDLQPNKAKVEQVRFAGLKTSAIVGPDKRPNFLSVLPAPTKTSAAAAPTTAPTPAATEPFPIQLDELKFENASVHFSDLSLQPACTFDLQQFGGTIKGLSTKADSAAKVDLAGKLDEASPFGVRGTLNPLARELELALAFTNRNLQLTPFTPYTEKYVGHALNKGRLTLNLDYSIHEKALKAQNKVRIDQLMFGPRNDSTNAPKLPIKLAVALLKDSNGAIDLDLPVEGRLDDPKFSVGPIIVKVVVNLIVKAVASPFKLLGALVGGGEEMSYVDFTPGLAKISDTETNKLDKLIAALEKRPALNLEIEGSINPATDRDILAAGLVRQQIKTQRLKELSETGHAPASADAFQIEPAEHERLLRASLIKTFGTNLEEAIRALASRATNAAAVAARPTVRNPGLLQRLLSLFRSGQERRAISQAHRNAKTDALLLKQNPALAAFTADDMELLLAAKTEVPPENLRQLMQDRARAVQAYLLTAGKITAERLFLAAPKTPDATFKGDARVNLSLN